MQTPEETALVLFDIDGTVLHKTGPHHRQALEAGILEVTGLRTTTEGIDTAGRLDRDLIRAMLQGAGIQDEIPEEQVSSIAAACEAAYLKNCASDLQDRVCPGVRELLEVLRAASVPVGVVTGNLRAIGWKKLELAGLRDYFCVGAFSQDGNTRSALARTAVERALEHQRCGSFRGVTLLGDHRNDVVAAKANGFRAIAVATGVLSAAELAREGPDLVVDDMRGLSLAAVLQAKKFSSLDTSLSDNRNSSAPMVPST